MSWLDSADLLPTSRALQRPREAAGGAYECDVHWVSRQTIARNRVTRHAFALKDLKSHANGARQNKIRGHSIGDADSQDPR